MAVPTPWAPTSISEPMLGPPTTMPAKVPRWPSDVESMTSAFAGSTVPGAAPSTIGSVAVTGTIVSSPLAEVSVASMEIASPRSVMFLPWPSMASPSTSVPCSV